MIISLWALLLAVKDKNKKVISQFKFTGKLNGPKTIFFMIFFPFTFDFKVNHYPTLPRTVYADNKHLMQSTTFILNETFMHVKNVQPKRAFQTYKNYLSEQKTHLPVVYKAMLSSDPVGFLLSPCDVDGPCVGVNFLSNGWPWPRGHENK